MDVGLVLPGKALSLTEMLTVSRAAETTGLRSVYCVETSRDPLVVLAAIATQTTRVRLGPFILNAQVRTPFSVAMSLLDLDELSDGRFVLCLGVGNRQLNEQHHGVSIDRPVTKMREYMTLVRLITRATPGEMVSFNGTIHSVRDWRASADHRPAATPLMLAAIHPQMRRVAAEAADGIAMGALCSPSYLKEVVRPKLAADAHSAGRSASDLCLLAACLVAVDEDGDAARAMMRQSVARMFWPIRHSYYEFLLREQGFGGVVDQIARAMADRNAVAAASAVPDELLDAVTVCGTPAECRSALPRWEGAVDELVLVNAAFSGSSEAASRRKASAPEMYELLFACV